MFYFLLVTFVIVTILGLTYSSENRYAKYVFILIGIILVLLATFRGEGSDRDYSTYIDLFNSSNGFKSLFIEPTFLFISWIIKFFLDNNIIYLFLFYAVLGIGLKLYAIKQLSDLWFLSLIIYLSGFYLVHDLTQIRVGVASALLLLNVKSIYERDWKKFLVISFFAILFHYSAIIILPLWFLNATKPQRFFLISIVPISYLIFFLGVKININIPFEYVQQKLNVYQALQRSGTGDFDKINVFNLIQLFKIAIYYLFIYKLDIIINRNRYSLLLIKVFAISLCSIPFFAFMPILGFRISEFYGIVEIILIPFLFYIFKPLVLSRLIVIAIGFLWIFTALFYNSIIK